MNAGRTAFIYAVVQAGTGRAVAVLFAREGADVAVAYRNEHADAEETKRAECSSYITGETLPIIGGYGGG